jgi:hypothetical protein
VILAGGWRPGRGPFRARMRTGLHIKDGVDSPPLPGGHVEKLGLRDRVRVHLEADSIRITPAEQSPDADS